MVVPKWIDMQGAEGGAQVFVSWFHVDFAFLDRFKSKSIEVLGFLNLKVFCYVNLE